MYKSPIFPANKILQTCIYKYMDMLDIFQRLQPPPMMRNKHMTTDMKANPLLDQSTRSELAFQPISLTPGPRGLCFTVIFVPHYLNIFAYIATPLPTREPAAHRMLALSLSKINQKWDIRKRFCASLFQYLVTL